MVACAAARAAPPANTSFSEGIGLAFTATGAAASATGPSLEPPFFILRANRRTMRSGPAFSFVWLIVMAMLVVVVVVSLSLGPRG